MPKYFYCRWCCPGTPLTLESEGFEEVRCGNKMIPICNPCMMIEKRSYSYKRFRYEIGCKYAGQYKNRQEFEEIFKRCADNEYWFGADFYEEHFMKWDPKYLLNMDYYLKYSHI
jgi:hypothetical protein